MIFFSVKKAERAEPALPLSPVSFPKADLKTEKERRTRFKSLLKLAQDARAGRRFAQNF
jgi:hypothetical protein